MKKYENIVIGFGKGGKTLAGALASAGQSTAVIERSPLMYGGTCINVACIPSKSLEASARMSEAIGGSFGDRAARYSAAIAEKRRLTAMLRGKNYDKAVSAGVDVIDGAASFTGPHSLMVKTPGGEKINLEAERIFINTGSRPFMPSIEGLGSCRFVYTSETLMELDSLPEKLIIIGGGYIGLEFASYYANFGSQVTVIQDGSEFMPREDEDIAKAVLASFNKRGIEFVSGARVTRVADDGGAGGVFFGRGGAYGARRGRARRRRPPPGAHGPCPGGRRCGADAARGCEDRREAAHHGPRHLGYGRCRGRAPVHIYLA
jgi:pyruvate/2-oxoglutarate dehydrogenase complex dihydrolipoamide dehydrogenase (E3) component